MGRPRQRLDDRPPVRWEWALVLLAAAVRLGAVLTTAGAIPW